MTKERRVLLANVKGRWARRLIHNVSTVGLAVALTPWFGSQGGVVVWAPDRHGHPVSVFWHSPDPTAKRPIWFKDIPWFTVTTIFLTSGTTWATPGDWNNASNSIECIGAGSNAFQGIQGIVSSQGGTAGGYSKVTNQTATGTINIQVGVGGTNATSSWWKTTGTVLGVGGLSGDTAVGTVIHAGGNDGGFGACGGGAGGPNAAGNNGNVSQGGQGDGTFGGTGGSPGDGNAGTEFDASHGSGGGGGITGNGGLYGGAGGTDGNTFAGAGANGLIVITYTPAGGGAAPFAQGDWPNPRGYILGIALRTWTDPLKINLRGQDKFFTTAGRGPTYDWLNPRGYGYPLSLRTWVDPVKLSLSGKDLFFTTAGRGPVYDWPNPRGYVYPLLLRSWLDPLKLLLLGKDKFYGASGEPPPNYNWPNPQGYIWPAGIRGWFSSVAFNLLGQDTFYGAPGEPPPNYDQQNPRGYAYPLPLRSWLDPLKLLLLGRDTFFGAPGQPPTYDWPNPRRAAWPVWSWAESLVTSTLALIVLPFALLDWPNPRGYAWPTAVRGWLSSIAANLIGQDTFYGAPGEAPPNSDQPTPRGYAYPVQLRTWLASVAANLIGQDQFYGAPGQVPTYDWPNPRRPRWPVWTWTTSLVTTTLAVLVLPFSLLDWPNPRGYFWPVKLRTFIQNFYLLSGQDKFYGGPGEPPPNYDQPNPRGYAYPMALRTWLIQWRMPLSFAGLVARFFGAAARRRLVGISGPRPAGVAQRRRLVAVATVRFLVSPARKRRLVGKAVPGMSFTGNLQPPFDAGGEALTVGWDFGPILAASATLIGTPVITITVANSSVVTDPSPQNRVLSSATIVASQTTGAPLAQVNALFGGAGSVAGVEYIGLCSCGTSDGQTLSLWWKWECKQPG